MLYDDLVQPGEYICHHGVKGQKWGVRRIKETVGIFKKRKLKKQETQKRHRELADKIKSKEKITTIDLAGYPWSLDKFGNFVTYATEIPISIRKTQIDNADCRSTLDALLKNWDKVGTVCTKANSEYMTKNSIPVDGGNYSSSKPDQYHIYGRDSVGASHYHDYGIVTVDINPRTQQVYSIGYDD